MNKSHLLEPHGVVGVSTWVMAPREGSVSHPLLSLRGRAHRPVCAPQRHPSPCHSSAKGREDRLRIRRGLSCRRAAFQGCFPPKTLVVVGGKCSSVSSSKNPLTDRSS